MLISLFPIVVRPSWCVVHFHCLESGKSFSYVICTICTYVVIWCKCLNPQIADLTLLDLYLQFNISFLSCWCYSVNPEDCLPRRLHGHILTEIHMKRLKVVHHLCKDNPALPCEHLNQDFSFTKHMGHNWYRSLFTLNKWTFFPFKEPSIVEKLQTWRAEWCLSVNITSGGIKL